MTLPATGAARPEAPFGWRFTTPLLLGSTLNPINSSMLATGLVGIGLSFHASPGTTASLISVLYLCSAIMQPTMGKLASLFGLRRVFLVGIVILFIAGIVGTAAPTFWVLLLSRALIGIGTSAGYPTAMALVRQRADRAGIGVPSQLLGNISIASQVTAVLGLPLGGFLVGVFGWRALFAVNMPLAAATLVFALAGVPRDEPRPRVGGQHLLTAIDLPGILLFAGTVASLLLFLSHPAAAQLWLLILAALLAAAFFIWEQRTSHPLIDIRMLRRNWPLQRTYLRQLLVALGTYASLYGSSQWMQQSAHLGAFAIGLLLLPQFGLSIVMSRVISRRGWVRRPLILSGVATLLVAGIMLLITHNSGIPILIVMSLLLGCTSGFSNFSNQAALYVQAPAEQMAVASGLFRTFGYIGAIFSSSLLGISFGAAATDRGFHNLAWVLAVIGLLTALLAMLDKSIPNRTK